MLFPHSFIDILWDFNFLMLFIFILFVGWTSVQWPGNWRNSSLHIYIVQYIKHDNLIDPTGILVFPHGPHAFPFNFNFLSWVSWSPRSNSTNFGYSYDLVDFRNGGARYTMPIGITNLNRQVLYLFIVCIWLIDF